MGKIRRAIIGATIGGASFNLFGHYIGTLNAESPQESLTCRQAAGAVAVGHAVSVESCSEQGQENVDKDDMDRSMSIDGNTLAGMLTPLGMAIGLGVAWDIRRQPGEQGQEALPAPPVLSQGQ